MAELTFLALSSTRKHQKMAEHLGASDLEALVPAGSAVSDASPTAQPAWVLAVTSRTSALTRQIILLLLTLAENIGTIYMFDSDRFSEQLIFAVFVVQPIIMTCADAVSLETETAWDDFIVGIATECTQTFLFIYFCSFQPLPTAFLLVPFGLQIVGLLVGQDFDALRRRPCCDCSWASATSSSIGVICAGLAKNADFKQQMQMLLFGAASSMLPLLCKTGETESERANAFITYTASQQFGLLMTIFLWCLEVKVFDLKTKDANSHTAWKSLAGVAYLFVIGYAVFIAGGSLVSVWYLLWPIFLAFAPSVSMLYSVGFPILMILTGLYAVAKAFDAFGGKPCLNVPAKRHPCRCAGQHCCTITICPGCSAACPKCNCSAPIARYLEWFWWLAIRITAVLLIGCIAYLYEPIFNFLNGCGGLLLGWSTINIVFVIGVILSEVRAEGDSGIHLVLEQALKGIMAVIMLLGSGIMAVIMLLLSPFVLVASCMEKSISRLLSRTPIPVLCACFCSLCCFFIVFVPWFMFGLLTSEPVLSE